jgi:hypothetical protein
LSLQINSIAAALWSVKSQNSFIAAEATLKELHQSIDLLCPKYVCSLLIGSSTWQPNTRIVRYYGLKGAMERQGFLTPPMEEIILETENKIKYFGISVIKNESSWLPKILVGQPNCYLCVTKNPLGISNIPKTGWTGNYAMDLDFILNIAFAGGILIKRFGDFDDIERGLLMVGSSDLIEKMSRN